MPWDFERGLGYYHYFAKAILEMEFVHPCCCILVANDNLCTYPAELMTLVDMIPLSVSHDYAMAQGYRRSSSFVISA